jgi:hypothetical protein
MGRLFWAAALMAGFSLHASAEYATQRIWLQPGWNSVFFEVQPEPRDCQDLFKGVPVASVWVWNQRFTSVQYVRDPSELEPEQPEWLTYFPEGTANSFLTDLFAITGGESYLIELSGNEPVELVVQGPLFARSKPWLSNSFNLMGFHVDPGAPPTFADYFASSEAHDGQAVFRLNGVGGWQAIANPSTERIVNGEAYWIYCEGNSQFVGPLHYDTSIGSGLRFEGSLREQTLELINDTDVSKVVTLDLKSASAEITRPRDASQPPLGGQVALTYLNLNAEKKRYEWEPLDSPLTVTVEPESSYFIKLGVQRNAMPDPDSKEARFESILEIKDGTGSFFRVPVSAQKAVSLAGLWSGTVGITLVSEAANPEDSVTPKPASSEFQFRVIVHMDDTGQANLLQRVLVMQLSASFIPDPDNPGLTILDEPARSVLITDETLIPSFPGVAEIDGRMIARRVSSPVFGFNEPQPMLGSFTTNLTTTVTMPFDDPLNPFVHRYDPDHDNLDERFEKDLTEGIESWTFQREITMSFEPDDPEGFEFNSWGEDVIGGTYHERVTGVHKNSIYTQGIFRLTRVSSVDVLNDGLK